MIESVESVLRQQLEDIDARIDELTAEKAKIKKAMKILGGNATKRGPKKKAAKATGARKTTAKRGRKKVKEPSVKNKVLIALDEQFPKGAEKNDLYKYILERWNKKVMPNSLGTTLSTMKKSRELTHDGKLWKLGAKANVKKAA